MNAFLLALVAAHVPIFLPSPSPAAPVLFVPPLGTAVVPDMPPDPDGEVLVPPNVTPQTKPVPQTRPWVGNAPSPPDAPWRWKGAGHYQLAPWE